MGNNREKTEKSPAIKFVFELLIWVRSEGPDTRGCIGRLPSTTLAGIVNNVHFKKGGYLLLISTYMGVDYPLIPTIPFGA